MATLNGSASGAVGHSGSARGRYVLREPVDGAVGHSGSARGIVVTGTHITQFGLEVDAGQIAQAQATQLGLEVDANQITPTQVTQFGLEFDVTGIVPIHTTTTGLGLDVDRIVPAQLSTIGAMLDARYRRVRTLTMCWEFHVFTRGGTYLTYLDNAFGKSYLSQLWDVGGGSFKLPTSDPKATTTNLKVGNIVKVRYANVDIGAWIMENIATTYVDTGEGAARIITVSGRGLVASLQKALVYPTDLSDPKTVERTFTDKTKAEIFLTFYNEFILRGGGLFTTSFTAFKDTNLADWTDSISLKFKAGQTLLDVLRQLQGFGLEIVAQPDKTLDAYLSAGTDKSTSVVFRYGQNMLSCTQTTQGSDIANVVLGEAQNVLDEDTNTSSVSSYGRMEAYLPVRNTADAGDIAEANNLFLKSYADPPNSIALQVATFPEYPLLDYDIGDTVHVTVPGENGVGKSIDADYRILGIAMQEGDGPCDLRVTLELNSMAAEYLARLQRAMDASLASVQPAQGAASGLASSSTSAAAANPVQNLNDLDDVVITAVTDNELLSYDAATGNWINQTASELGLASASGGSVVELYVGDKDGPHAGLFYALRPDTEYNAYFQAADTAKEPFFSVGGVDYATNSSWVQIGYVDPLTGKAPIRLADYTAGTADPEEQPRLEIDAAYLVNTGALTGNMATDALWDAKGDLAVGTANNAATVLPVGTVDGLALLVDSAAATGLKWGTVNQFTFVSDLDGTQTGYLKTTIGTIDYYVPAYTGAETSDYWPKGHWAEYWQQGYWV